MCGFIQACRKSSFFPDKKLLELLLGASMEKSPRNILFLMDWNVSDIILRTVMGSAIRPYTTDVRGVFCWQPRVLRPQKRVKRVLI